MEKKLHLCAVGNALMDLQYEVQDDILDLLNVNKGEMTLIDDEKRNKIMSFLGKRQPNQCSGGSAANTIIGFAGFGGKAGYMTSIGKDELGNFYANEFKEFGIELSGQQTDDEATGTCVVLITPDSERTMMTTLGASALFTKDDIDEDMIAKSEWIYIEGYEFSQESSANAVLKAIELAKKHGTKVAITFSDVFIIDVFGEPLRKAVEQADLIFCNETEAAHFTGKDEIGEIINEMKTKVENFVITRGGEGALVRWDTKLIMIKSFPTKLMDTTGAGDMFAAGFLYGLIVEGDPKMAGDLGSYAASKVVAQYGARLKEDHKEVRDNIINGKG